MHFLQTGLLSIAALASLVAAQSNVIKVTKNPGPCVAGQSCTVEFESTASGPVTITLRKGSSTNLKDVEVLTSSASPGSYTFTPKTTLAPGSDYAIMLQQGGEINYSGQFAITGGTGSTSSSSASSSASSTASTSSTLTTSSSASSTTSTTSGASTTSSRASAGITPSANGTSLVTPSLTRTSTSTSSTGSSTNTPPSSGYALQASTPLALLLGAMGAFLFMN